VTGVSTMEEFAQSMVFADRIVVDRTNVSGELYFRLEFAPEPNLPFVTPPELGIQPDPSGPSLREALRSQLGLKLQPASAAVDVLVIDHVEEPTAN